MFRSILLIVLFSPIMTLANSSVEIAVKLSPAGSFTAKTSKVKGKAYSKSGKVLAKKIQVDLRTIETGIALRDKHLKERLNVEKYPFATLVQATGNNGKGKAIIALKGAKLKVEGTYKTEDKHLIASFPIHLPDLKINDVRYMGVGVKDEVVVTVSVPLAAYVKRIPTSK